MAGWLDATVAGQDGLERDLAALAKNTALDLATCLADVEAVSAFGNFCLYGASYSAPSTDAGQNPQIAEVALLAHCCHTTTASDAATVLQAYLTTWSLEPGDNALINQALQVARETAGDGLTEADALREALDSVLESYHEDFVADVLAYYTAAQDPEPTLYAFFLDLETDQGRQEAGFHWHTRDEALELLGVGGIPKPADALNKPNQPGTVNGIKITSTDGVTTVRAFLSLESVRAMNKGQLVPGSSAYILGGSVLLTTTLGSPEGRLAVRLAGDLDMLGQVSLAAGWGGVRIADDLPKEISDRLSVFLPKAATADPQRPAQAAKRKAPELSAHRVERWRHRDGAWQYSAAGSADWGPAPGTPRNGDALIVVDDAGTTLAFREYKRTLATKRVRAANPKVKTLLAYGETPHGPALNWNDLCQNLEAHGFDAEQARNRLIQHWENDPGSAGGVERLLEQNDLIDVALQLRVDLSHQINVEWIFLDGGSPVKTRGPNEQKIRMLHKKTGHSLPLIEYEKTLIIDPTDPQRRAMQLAATLDHQEIRTGMIKSAKSLRRHTYISVTMDDQSGPSQELTARVAACDLKLRSTVDADVFDERLRNAGMEL